MGHKVIHQFTDLQDFNHLYNVGDVFPRSGKSVSQTRLNELACGANKLKKPLIKDMSSDFSKYMNPPKKVEGERKQTYTKTEINRMPIIDLRLLAEGSGIDNAQQLTGAEIKRLLIEKFGL